MNIYQKIPNGDEASGWVSLIHVQCMTGLSASGIYRQRKAGGFPQGVRAARNGRLQFRRAEIERWVVDNRPASFIARAGGAV